MEPRLNATYACKHLIFAFARVSDRDFQELDNPYLQICQVELWEHLIQVGFG